MLKFYDWNDKWFATPKRVNLYIREPYKLSSTNLVACVRRMDMVQDTADKIDQTLTEPSWFGKYAAFIKARTDTSLAGGAAYGDGSVVDLSPGNSDGTPANPTDPSIALSANTLAFVQDTADATVAPPPFPGGDSTVSAIGGFYSTLKAWADSKNLRNFKWYNEAEPNMGLGAIRFTNGRLKKFWIDTGVRRFETVDDLREKLGQHGCNAAGSGVS